MKSHFTGSLESDLFVDVKKTTRSSLDMARKQEIPV